MSNKKKTLIFILLGVLAIVLGLIIMLISNIKKDQQQMNQRMNKISSSYDVFKKEVEEVNLLRDSIHKEFLDTIYYETFIEQEGKYRKSLYDYEKKVTDLSKKNAKLKEYCKNGIYYSSSDVNNKCSAFNLAYEQLINTFVDDVNKYNGNIKEYNKWVKGQNKIEQKTFKNYETKKTYIDYNQDGQYSGKEE